MSTTPDRPDPNEPPTEHAADEWHDSPEPADGTGDESVPAPVTEPISGTSSQTFSDPTAEASPEAMSEAMSDESEPPEQAPAPPPPPSGVTPQADAPAPPPPPTPTADQPWSPQPSGQPAGPTADASPAYGAPAPGQAPAYGAPAPGQAPAYGAPAPGPAPAYGAPVGAPLSPQEEKGWSLAAHLLVLVAGFLAPLIIWLVFKGRGPFLEHHAKESLNFQITVTIAALISGLAIFLFIGIVMILALIPWMIIMPIIAAVKANNGEWYRYPLTLRLIK